MCPPGYYQSANGPMVTHTIGHMMYGSYTVAYISLDFYDRIVVVFSEDDKNILLTRIFKPACQLKLVSIFNPFDNIVIIYYFSPKA